LQGRWQRPVKNIFRRFCGHWTRYSTCLCWREPRSPSVVCC